jgi:hypothetical protein
VYKYCLNREVQYLVRCIYPYPFVGSFRKLVLQISISSVLTSRKYSCSSLLRILIIQPRVHSASCPICKSWKCRCLLTEDYLLKQRNGIISQFAWGKCVCHHLLPLWYNSHFSESSFYVVPDYSQHSVAWAEVVWVSIFSFCIDISLSFLSGMYSCQVTSQTLQRYFPSLKQRNADLRMLVYR